MTRLRSAALGLAVAATVAAGSAGAQPRPIKNLGNDVQYFAQDVGWVWTSPVHGDQRGWIVAGATGAAALLLMPLDEPLDNWVKRDTMRAAFRALKPFRKGGGFYGGSFLAPIAGAAYLAGLAFDKPDVRDAVIGCGTSWFANSYGRKIGFYQLIGRARPLAERGSQNWQVPRDSAWNWRSFPGGHVSNVAACASFFGNRFEWGIVEPALYGLAFAVGAGRIPDRAHWLSDQVVGAVFGYAIGKAVADRQLERRARRLARDLGTAPTGQAGSVYANPDPESFKVGWQVKF